jgi:protein TonB
MKSSLLILILFVSFSSRAQSKNDTVYYSADWKKTTRDSASYYRVIKEDGSMFKVEDHYLNGKLQMSGTYSSLNPEVRQGYFKYYSETGILTEEGEYDNNKHQGKWSSYYLAGQLGMVETYKDDNLDGDFILYYPDGKLRRKEIHKDTVVTNAKCYDKSGKEVAYYPYQQMPRFNGDLYDYLAKNTVYPKRDVKKGIEGRVVVSFAIGKDGSVGDVKIVKSSDDSRLDKKAIKVVESMPRWQPGMQDSIPVKIYYNIPIVFQLQ